MKTKLVAVILLISSQAISQAAETPNFKKHSLGLDYQFNAGNPNIGITYRKFYEGSRFNFKASLLLGGSNNYTFSSQRSDLFYRTNDTSIPFLGVNNANLTSRSYRSLELGVERVAEFKKLDIISGIAVNISHVNTSQFSEVYEAGEEEVVKNGNTYYQLVNKNREDLEGLNALTSTFNYVSTGLTIHAGIKLDLSTKLYFTTLLTIRSNAQFVVSEKNEYRNELYKEHLPSQRGANTFNFDTGFSAGLHYKF